jgi:hypothetical protein
VNDGNRERTVFHRGLLSAEVLQNGFTEEEKSLEEKPPWVNKTAF